MLLSSLAECVYWFGRYVERTENTARMILVNDSLLLDIPPHCNPGWTPLIDISGNTENFLANYANSGEREVIRFLVTDGNNNPGAMVNSIAMARENLRTTRALFPKTVWEVVNDLHAHLRENKSAVFAKRRRYRFLRQVIDACHLVVGKLAATMSHDDIYEFFRMGSCLERADMTSRVIDVRAKHLLTTSRDGLQPFDDIQWKSVLDSLAAWQMYRRRNHNDINGDEVLRFLISDQHFPRAISHCLNQIERSLGVLTTSTTSRTVLGQTKQRTAEVDIEALPGDQLHEFIDKLQQDFLNIHEELSSYYFEGRDVVATYDDRECPEPLLSAKQSPSLREVEVPV